MNAPKHSPSNRMPAPLRAPPGRSEGWALRGFTHFVPIDHGLCWARTPSGEDVMVQVEAYPNVEFRDAKLREHGCPRLFEVSQRAWLLKAQSLRRMQNRKRQKRTTPSRGALLSITAAAMFVPGKRENVIARIKQFVPLRPAVGGRTKHLVLWDDVLDAFPIMKKS